MTNTAEAKIRGLLEQADIHLNGNRPWDLHVNDARLFARIMSQGTLGLGEAYMDGWWDCAQVDEMVCRAMRARLERKISVGAHELWSVVRGSLANLQSKARAFIVGEHHYDLSSALYQRMLDARMTYTCGYWRDADNLDIAQLNKLDLVCRKIGLKPGDRVLDIGCGWGSFAHYAALNYGVSVVGITISKEQAALASQNCRDLPVEIRLQDYRDLDESFDYIVSLGMFEHVGSKNFRTYMQIAHRCLRDNGLFLLHTIGSNESVKSGDRWIDKHIFPNGLLPSIAQIGRAVEELFVMEDWHNFGTDYDRTLMAWLGNFEKHWAELSVQFDQRFYRMWRYYLLICAGSFRARKNQLWQIVLSKHGVPGGYLSLR